MIPQRIPGGWGRQRAILPAFFVLCAVVLAALLLAWGTVGRQLDRLRAAETDNLTWNMTQFQVDYLQFMRALHRAAEAPPQDRAAAAEALRLRFDLLYSRVHVFEGSALHRILAAQEAVPLDALEALAAELARAMPRIEAPDARLIPALPGLEAAFAPLDLPLREMVVLGVRATERETTLRREQLRLVMERFALATGLMIALMGVVIGYVAYLNAAVSRRSHELARLGRNQRAAFDAALDSIIVFDRAGRVRELNRAAEATFGLDREQVQGRDLAGLILAGSEHARFRQALADQLAHGRSDLIGRGLVSFVAQHADGRRMTIEAALMPAVDDDDQPFFAGFLRDVSERLAAEARLKQALAEARLGDETKRRILTVVSHELRTPLNGLIGALEVLIASDRLTEDTRALASAAAESAGIAIHIANNALDSSLLLSGECPEPAVQPFDLEALLEEVVAPQRLLAQKQGTELALAPGPGGRLLGDPHILSIALTNLVNNAVKFTPGGRVAVTPVLRRDAGGELWLQVTIADSGPGIAPEDHARIFNDFETLETDLARESRGMGLGLGIVRRAVEMLRGALHLDSAPGAGARFTLAVPVRLAGPAPDRLPPPCPALRVLVVEDNAINALVLREMLATLGVTSDEAADGRRAAELAGDGRYDLILMDVAMPEMDGIAATRAIRSGGASAGARIVGLTAYSQPAERRRFLEAGMDAVAVKPVTRAKLALILAGAEPAAPEAAPPPEPEPDPENEALRGLGEVMGGQKLAGLFERFAQDLAAFRAAAGARGAPPLPPLAEEAHRLAGAAALFGLLALREGLLDYERAALAGKRRVAWRHLRALAALEEGVLAPARRQIAALA